MCSATARCWPPAAPASPWGPSSPEGDRRADRETHLDDAIVAVLAPRADSAVNMLNMDSLTKDALLFFDQQLNELILSDGSCKPDGQREECAPQIHHHYHHHQKHSMKKKEKGSIMSAKD